MSEDIAIMILKTFFINLFTYYICMKISKQQDDKLNKYVIIIIASMVGTFLYGILDKKINHIFIIVLMYIIQLVFLNIILNKEEQSLLITNLIATAMVYIGFTISSFVEGIFRKTLKISDSLLNLFFILCLEAIMIKLFFRLKRFNRGFSFINNKLNNDYIEFVIINISALLIFIYCIFGNGNGSGDIVRQMIIPFIILGILMLITIQKTLTLYYKQKLLSKTIEDYKNELADKDEQIKKLSEEKYEISKLNHQFYNRQKALELKVQEVISDINIEAGNELAIVKQIDDLSKEYSKGLEGIKGLDKLSSTNVEEIDDMFKYMQAECKKNDIDFKLQINGNINHMINKIIQKNKLETLIGDHIRDAIIAINAGNNKFRSILTILGIKDDCYELCIYDSGVEFTIDTLLKLGIEPTTTHRDTGGSGIGFMTTFETMKETKASLIINEKSTPSVNDYTKAVTIRFDGKNEYRICSYREDKIKKKTKDNRIIICNQNRSI